MRDNWAEMLRTAKCLIDLHLHLDGSLSLACVRKLAKMQGIACVEDDASLLSRLRADEECADLNAYLTKFDFPLALLQTPEAIECAVYTLCEELAAQGLLYAEIRFAPQLHTRLGLTQARVVEAAAAGVARTKFPANLILCCMRGADNHRENIETVHVAKAYQDRRVCAIDLAGAEALYETRRFADIFRLAWALGVPYTIHAGEADGASSVAAALDFGARRIGHGVRAAEDKALLERLARARTTLELCPTSNLNTRVFSDIAQYPLRELMDAGVRVTINSDNCMVSGTCLRAEFQKVIDALHLTRGEVETLLLNAADAAFADEATKARLRACVEAQFARQKI